MQSRVWEPHGPGVATGWWERHLSCPLRTHGALVLPLPSSPTASAVNISMDAATVRRTAGGRAVVVGAEVSRSHGDHPGPCEELPGTQPLLQLNSVQEQKAPGMWAGITAERVRPLFEQDGLRAESAQSALAGRAPRTSPKLK